VNHFFSMIFFLFDPTLESYFTSKGKNYIKLNFYCQFRFKKLNQFLKIDFHSHIKQKLKKSFIGRQRYYLKWKWRSCKKLWAFLSFSQSFDLEKKSCEMEFAWKFQMIINERWISNLKHFVFRTINLKYIFLISAKSIKVIFNKF